MRRTHSPFHGLKLGLILTVLALVLGVGLALPDTAQAQVQRGSNWQGQYFDNVTLTGSPTFSRIDPIVQFTFTGGVTDSNTGLSVGPEFYSVRWTTTEFFAAGTYTFSLTRMDDARVLFDGAPIINYAGADQDIDVAQFVTATTQITEGNHTLTVEMIVRTGTGSIQFQWQSGGSGGGEPIVGPTATPTVTALPDIPPGALRATVIRAAVLNVRSAPSLGASRLGTILRGQTYAVVGRDESARWFLLQLSQYQGWAWGYYLFIDGNEFNAPVVSPFGTIGVPPGVVDTGVVSQATATLKLRAGPSVATAQIGRVTWGGFLPVIGRTADGFWYKVVWKGTVGWVYSPFVNVIQGDINVVPVE